jgi:hypothetical protein
MAYFNHAFNKVFVGTGGLAGTAGTATTALTAGQFTFVDPTTWVVPAGGIVNGTTLSCPLVLVAKSIYANDKIGPFHGGYQESVKSKIINPKYISAFYKVDNCPLRQESISVGYTSDNSGYTPTVPAGITASTPNIQPCVNDFAFVCGETYYLRVDLKGAPNLRYLSRNNYFTASAYTGCCDASNTVPNPTIVYVNWAYQLLNSPLVNPFIRIKIQYAANATTAPTTLNSKWFTSSVADLAQLLAYVNDPSTLPGGASDTTNKVAGMIIQGAYVDTQFGDCTFYPNDALQAYLEPVKLYASMVDYNGEPCAFTGVCVRNTCLGRQGQGFGENIIRELILSEGYNQSPFYTGMDLRIREITQGYNVTTAISRTTQYDRYFIQHSVPRFNNPTGTFDNDQYLLEVIVPSGFVGTAFENFVDDWIANAQGATCIQMATYGCASSAVPSPCALTALT